MLASNDGRPMRRVRIQVQGIVQGVGFRPFVHRVAATHGLSGHVLNYAGGVDIEVEGPPDAVDALVRALRAERPPIAVITSVECTETEPIGEQGFRILASEDREHGRVLISPDVALCADCERELCDPGDRRFGHPFINCTNCGPRFTIVRSAPYDRPLTSMAPFPMCPACQAEYDDITNRRYHAQPNSCPACGPTLGYRCGAYRANGREALLRAIDNLKAGRILAIRGLGGFHLACDAGSDAAVATLRARKHREEKPLALMAPDLDTARALATTSPEAESLLTSPQRPIVLLPRRSDAPVSRLVAPDTNLLGLMLPYTPLHLLLLRAIGGALVMTSGNLSDEPLATDNDEAYERLGGIADAFLTHDREIVVPCDDSVVRPTPAGDIIMRRARGYVPFPVELAWSTQPVLAVGGHLKNTFCLTDGPRAFPSQHLGDLDDARTLSHFEWSLDHLCSVLRIEPVALACDEHPAYWSTRIAHERAEALGLPLFPVQHHHAHIVSCLADNGADGPVIGLALDGSGHGEDGTVWGFEVLKADRIGFTRLAHLEPMPLPGGEAAIKEPLRSAAALLWQALGEDFASYAPVTLADRLEARWPVWRQMIEAGVNCPWASSAGRLFDGVSALLGLGDMAAYEGQAAMKLEALAAPRGRPYEWALNTTCSPSRVDPRPMIREVVADMAAGASAHSAATRFHATVVDMLARTALHFAGETGLRAVALSGGSFQNAILLADTSARLRDAGLSVLVHRAVPPNDGGLSLGQAVIAAARLDVGYA